MQKRKIFISFSFLILFMSFAKANNKNQNQMPELLDKFSKVLHLIETEYPFAVSMAKVIEGAIKGALETLDSHSLYLPEQAFEKLEDETQGRPYGGIGIEVTPKEGVLIVTSTVEGSPAFKAGLVAGDKIVEIEGSSVSQLEMGEIQKKMMGAVGENLTLGIFSFSEKKMKTLILKREKIVITPLKSWDLEGNLLLVKLRQFQKGVGAHLSDLLTKKLVNKKGLILDLRGNPGGLLEESVFVCGLFISEGIVVSTEGKNIHAKEIRFAPKSGTKYLDIPLIVLVGSGSASAAEIVAGCLQDHERALIIGQRTFGKGSVQSVRKLTEKTGIKMTTGLYLTPKGKKIQGVGIVPDVSFPEMGGNWRESTRPDHMALRQFQLRHHISSASTLLEEEKLKQELQKKQQEYEEWQREKEKDTYAAYLANPENDFLVQQAQNLFHSRLGLKKFILSSP